MRRKFGFHIGEVEVTLWDVEVEASALVLNIARTDAEMSKVPGTSADYQQLASERQQMKQELGRWGYTLVETED